MKKIQLLVLILASTVSCRLMDNPVDQEADAYIGEASRLDDKVVGIVFQGPGSIEAEALGRFRVFELYSSGKREEVSSRFLVSFSPTGSGDPEIVSNGEGRYFVGGNTGSYQGTVIYTDLGNNRHSSDFTLQITSQQALYVSSSGADSGEGKQGSPFLTVQHAIDEAVARGISHIKIADGVYTSPNPILPVLDLVLEGGFSGVLDWSQDPDSYETILESTATAGGMDIDNPVAAVHMSGASGELRYLTLKASTGPTFTAGLLLQDGGGRISNCRIIGGGGSSAAIGLSVRGSTMATSPIIENCEISGGNSPTVAAAFGIRVTGQAAPSLKGNSISGGDGILSTGIYIDNSLEVGIISNDISTGSGSSQRRGIHIQDTIDVPGLEANIRKNRIRCLDGGAITMGIDISDINAEVKLADIEILGGEAGDTLYGIDNRARSLLAVRLNIDHSAVSADKVYGIYNLGADTTYTALLNDSEIRSGSARVYESFGVYNEKTKLVINGVRIDGGSSQSVGAYGLKFSASGASAITDSSITVQSSGGNSYGVWILNPEGAFQFMDSDISIGGANNDSVGLYAVDSTANDSLTIEGATIRAGSSSITQSIGLLVDTMDGLILRRSRVFSGTGPASFAVKIDSTSDNGIFNSILVSQGGGIHSAGILLSGASFSTLKILHNAILAGDVATTSRGLRIDANISGVPSPDSEVAYNLISSGDTTSGAGSYAVYEDAPYSHLHNFKYNNVFGADMDYGYMDDGATSILPSNIHTVDPSNLNLSITLSADDYHIVNPSSVPALTEPPGSGVSVDVPLDFDGAPRTAPVSIGPYEYD